MNYKDYFKNKRIAVIGLGAHGEMIADIKFLLRNKADVSLYDMRSEARVKGFVRELKETGLSTYAYGKIVDEELLGFDLIIISPEISRRSKFLKKAIEAGVEVWFPDILFFKLAPPITLIGIIGQCGKSTVAHFIYTMLKRAFAEYEDQGLFFIDPESKNGALTHLKKIKKGDVVLSRIPEHLLEYYHEMRISPHVAVATSLVSFDILEFQTHNNFIVAPDEVIDNLKSEPRFSSKAKMLRVRGSLVPTEWNISVKGEHDKENMALALQTGELFKVPTEITREAIESFIGLKGRIEMVKKVAGIEFFNDGASITPKATLSALRTIASGKNVVLILGGAYTGHDYDELVRRIPEYSPVVILLSGSGTLGLREKIETLPDVLCIQAFTLEEAVKKAKESARKGDRVLFSPGFDAVGIDISRRERGERFVKAVRAL